MLRVEHEFDPANEKTQHEDRYDRTLAYIYFVYNVRPQDNPELFDKQEWDEKVLVNQRLIEKGYCTTYRRFDFKHKDKFLELEKYAKENRRGLWG